MGLEEVGGWVGEKVEENEAIGMRCCGGWVGGWVGGRGRTKGANPTMKKWRRGKGIMFTASCGKWVGGWVGGWVSLSFLCLFCWR